MQYQFYLQDIFHIVKIHEVEISLNKRLKRFSRCIPFHSVFLKIKMNNLDRLILIYYCEIAQ